MLKGKILFTYIIFYIIAVFLYLQPVYGEEQMPGSNDIISKVEELISNNRASEAVSMLEEFINDNPGSRNEMIYIKIATIYDDIIMDFDKAIYMYNEYKRLFPLGDYYGFSSGRIRFLKENKADWNAIREYWNTVNKIDSTSSKTNNCINDYLNFLEHYPDSCVTHDIRYRVIEEYLDIKDYKSALKHMKIYIKSFDSRSVSNEDKEWACLLYSDILKKLERYHEALIMLKKANEVEKPEGLQSYHNNVIYSYKFGEIRRYLLSIYALYFFAGFIVIYWILMFVKKLRILFFSNKKLKILFLSANIMLIISLGYIIIYFSGAMEDILSNLNDMLKGCSSCSMSITIL